MKDERNIGWNGALRRPSIEPLSCLARVV